jgi:precorrin-6Y C5,15-methyltransferase (decarboxylating)
MSRWLSIVGLGEGGWPELSQLGQSLIAKAELVIGGERHLAMLPAAIPGRRARWSAPLTLSIEEILAHRGRPVAVLATGDPLHFGIGVTLARSVAIEEMLILPTVSAFSLVAARLGWPLAECECLTLHGRPLERLAGFPYPGARLLLLSHDGTTPAQIAAALLRHGFGPSRLVVLEHMGGVRERIVDSTAESWSLAQVADLNTVAVECRAGPGAIAYPRVPGLPDDAFHHDGQLTKREVRAATLSLLAPFPGQLLWDVGAGCGSIAIEWLRAGRDMKAMAIESDARRRDLIAENASMLGTPEIAIVAGVAPQALEGLGPPHAVFIGGGIAAPGVVEGCWTALLSGGRLVANAVTVEGEAALARHCATYGGSLARIAVSRAEPLGSHLGWRPLMPITQWSVLKP